MHSPKTEIPAAVLISCPKKSEANDVWLVLLSALTGDIQYFRWFRKKGQMQQITPEDSRRQVVSIFVL